MRLRLYHHPDGARVAYREAGTGPPLALVHSIGLSHREFEPAVEHLADRFRVVVPDLPLHGDSEHGTSHPYSPEWMADVVAGFCRDVLGPRPLVAGHGGGAELLVRAVASGALRPSRLVLMPNRLGQAVPRPAPVRAWRLAARAAAVPGLDRAISHAARLALRPSLGPKLSARHSPEARDLIRHALMDVGGNAALARSWSKFSRRWPMGPQPELLAALAEAPDLRVLLLWADRDPLYPLSLAEAAVGQLGAGELRVLSGTGFLIAYDDPVGVARELAWFCG